DLIATRLADKGTPLAFRARLLFFFQAEDGIRYLTVTGVQTCALPISGGVHRGAPPRRRSERARCGSGASMRHFSPHLTPALRPEIGRASCRERAEEQGVVAEVEDR